MGGRWVKDDDGGKEVVFADEKSAAVERDIVRVVEER